MANNADPDQLASSEASWSGSALFAKAGYINRTRVNILELFAIKYANLQQQSGSSNLIGWKLEVGVAS